MGFADRILRKQKRPGREAAMERARLAEEASKEALKDPSETVQRALRFTNKTVYDNKADTRAAIKRAIEIVEKTVLAIDSIQGLLNELHDLVDSVKQAPNDDKQALIASQYNDFIDRIPTLLEDARCHDINLIDGHGQSVYVPILLGREIQFVISHADLSNTERGLNLSKMGNNFSGEERVMALLLQIDKAIDLLDGTASIFCRDAEVLADHFDC